MACSAEIESAASSVEAQPVIRPKLKRATLKRRADVRMVINSPVGMVCF
jgi:hypothetical protein